MIHEIPALKREKVFHQGRIKHHESRIRSIEEAMADAVCPYRKGQRVMVERTIWKGMRDEEKIVEEWLIDKVEYQDWNNPLYEILGRKIKKNGEPTNFRSRWIRGNVLRVVE